MKKQYFAENDHISPLPSGTLESMSFRRNPVGGGICLFPFLPTQVLQNAVGESYASWCPRTLNPKKAKSILPQPKCVLLSQVIPPPENKRMMNFYSCP